MGGRTLPLGARAICKHWKVPVQRFLRWEPWEANGALGKTKENRQGSLILPTAQTRGWATGQISTLQIRELICSSQGNVPCSHGTRYALFWNACLRPAFPRQRKLQEGSPPHPHPCANSHANTGICFCNPLGLMAQPGGLACAGACWCHG